MRIYIFIISLALTIFEQSGSPAPQVSAEFKPEIAELAAQGLALEETLEASLDGSSRHLAAIFKRERGADLADAYEFRIIESDRRTVKTIFRRSDFHFSFKSFLPALDLPALNARDINGDGLKEVIVQSSSGGNCWSCNPAEIYRVRDHKAELIAAGPMQKIVDLDGDGVSELVVSDARWESYGGLAHAMSPSARMIYAWREGRYVYASRDFAAYYREEIKRLQASINESKAEITADEFSDEPYIGLAVSLAITYAHAGQVERGLDELAALINANAPSSEQKKRRASIIKDFRSGESAAKLRQLKYGDPIL
ncbi:MAG: hypothetical protein L0229_23580 [Blastocatellia bacterium]|nr:hypothetical protein [Blastocatellia bacterium]